MASFYFSVEEYFTCFNQQKCPVFILWKTDKTVMLGNNQQVCYEVDKDYADELNIKIVRRKSGGGAIYTDRGTVLFTVIEPFIDDFIDHREKVASSIINALSKMGVDAKREGRNDILIDGKKISGLAQYTSGNYVCTHGSLLFDTDLEVLSRVLIENEEKLIPKGIRSIRSRVTNIKQYLKDDITVDEFKNNLKKFLLTDKEYIDYKLSKEDLNKIKSISEEKYNNKKWNLGS